MADFRLFSSMKWSVVGDSWRLLRICAILFGYALWAGPVQKVEKSPTDNSHGEYVLQPNDLIKVQVFQEDDINRLGEVKVSQEYTIKLPLIQDVIVKGMTASEVAAAIRAKYLHYFVDPQVQVHVLERTKRFVYVNGRVNKAGEIQYPTERVLTLVEAITMAGGFDRYADPKRVTLRRTLSDGTIEVNTINVDELLKGESKGSWPLEPGDVINVKERVI